MKTSGLPAVVAANSLLEGDAVWMAGDGTWTRDIAQAAIARDAPQAAALLARAEGRPHEVVGPYLAEVSHGARAPQPVHFREAVRTRGPSNYFHGKQAGD